MNNAYGLLSRRAATDKSARLLMLPNCDDDEGEKSGEFTGLVEEKLWLQLQQGPSFQGLVATTYRTE